MKNFRDDIWGGLRIIFHGDHKAYRKTGVYGYPITGLPVMRRKLEKMMKLRMVAAYRKPLSEAARRAGGE